MGLHDATEAARDMLGRVPLLSLDRARELLRLNLPGPVASGTVPLAEALGRITSRPVSSPEALPPCFRATMDGYCLRAADTFGASEQLPAYLQLFGEVAMGKEPHETPPPGTCCRIATGGVLPPGTDAVIPFEQTVAAAAGLIEILSPMAVHANVQRPGEDVDRGEQVVGAGRRLRPRHLALLAGLGIRTVAVHRPVRVGIISSGDELVPPEVKPRAGCIRDMNGLHLSALAVEAGASPHHYGIAADEESALLGLVREALAADDLVLFSGSSSVGSRDLGEKIFAALEPPGMIFHGVAIKPGKPLLFGLAGERPVFGLPGHPVSAAITFDLFVLPAIRRLSGLLSLSAVDCPGVPARLMRNLNSAAGRTDFIRVRLYRPNPEAVAEAHPILGKSGALSTMTRADGYVVIEADAQGLREGEMVEVFLFDSFLDP